MASKKPKCGAAKKQGPGPCGNPAGFKTDHPGVGTCHLHLGNSQTHVAHAQEESARQAMATYGLPVDVDATDALLDLMRWTAGHVEYCRQQIQALAPEALTWGVTRRKSAAAELLEEDRDGPRDPADIELQALPEVTEEAGVNVWVKLYLEERTKLADVATRIRSLGIEERRVRLAEDQGLLVARALEQYHHALVALIAGELRRSDRPVVEAAVMDAMRTLLPRFLEAMSTGRMPELEAGAGDGRG
jgi:hypothetical protein